MDILKTYLDRGVQAMPQQHIYLHSFLLGLNSSFYRCFFRQGLQIFQFVGQSRYKITQHWYPLNEIYFVNDMASHIYSHIYSIFINYELLFNNVWLLITFDALLVQKMGQDTCARQWHLDLSIFGGHYLMHT